MLRRHLCFLLVVAFSPVKSLNNDSEIWANWLEDNGLFPVLPIAVPDSEDEQCREDSRKLILNLKNKTIWAVQMWDSSATNAFGVLYGNRYQIGNFDECLEVRSPIKSQYCLVKIQAYIHQKEAFEGDPYDINPPPDSTVWKKIEDSRKDPTKYARDVSNWGLCVPSSCNRTEMEKAINQYLSGLNEEFIKSNGTTYEVEILDKYCTDGKEKPFTYGEIGFWLVTWCICILIGSATFLDMSKKKEMFDVPESKFKGYLMNFSLKKNVLSIMDRDEGGKARETSILYGLRFYNVCYLVTDHKMSMVMLGALINSQKFESDFRTWLNIILPHGDLLVDTYFFIGGYLALLNLRDLYKKKFFNPFKIIANRFFRLAPLYYYIIWFMASGYSRFGSGPFWNLEQMDEIEFCKKNWWANLLFIQNYVNNKEMCLIHAWYVPCDMHFFIVAVFLVILIRKNKKIGAIALHLVTFISVLIPGIITYVYEINPIISFKPKLFNSVREDPSFEHLYIKSHGRIHVYLVGMLTGYYLFEKRESTLKISKLKSSLGCLLGLGLLFAPMWYGSLYYNPRKKYDLAEAVIFSMLRRLSWALGFTVFMIVNRFGDIPVVGNVFRWRIAVPLSKLTYSVYLIHFVLQLAESAAAQSPSHMVPFDVFVKATNNLVFATGYSLVLYLIIEVPIREISRKLLFPDKINKNVSRG